MEAKHQVHNLIILDESGSMDSIKKTIIQGFNELVQTVKGIEKQFPEQEHLISVVSFNGLGQKVLHFLDPVSQLEQIDDEKYQPNSLTPLFDAMGFGINKLRQALTKQTNYNVLVTVLTDGEENASKEFGANDIKKMIEALKLNRWTFTYIGTDHDVTKVAQSLAIDNTMAFQKNEQGIADMFRAETLARARFSKSIAQKKDTNKDFYKDDE